jgi:predicted nucleic acid-binding protein
LIYLDTSVALAHLLTEDRRPAESLWSERLVSSRLLEYELWIRLHARRLTRSHAAAADTLIAGLVILEMTPIVLARALEPFPAPIRTLDALHLASIEFLRSQGQRVSLASYDDRLLVAARSLRIPLADL